MKAAKGSAKRRKLDHDDLTTLSDKELVKLMQKGRKEAFEIIVKRYESKAYNLALSLCKCEEDAEEVLQDVFITVYTKIKGFEGKSAFSSWLYRITVNASFMKLRKNKQNKATPVEEITPAMENSWVNHEYWTPPTTDSKLANAELKRVLSDAINRLPEEYRAVFVLRDVDGLSNKETGEILGLTIPAVKSRLHRARLMLQKKLHRYYMDFVNPTQVIGVGPRYLQGEA
ncbi:MAG: sigma-70 family RNA polymerase sigma factor [Candidatus Dadabacteria bacterium]|nr:MAG: sigma-70 family RNA polymerase sigma factor [Candidatus Dadabacteria bacterium]